jgi:hypothetical protein
MSNGDFSWLCMHDLNLSDGVHSVKVLASVFDLMII